MKLIVIYIVFFLVFVALGYWLAGHSFAERGKDLLAWYATTMMFSAIFAACPVLAYDAYKDGK